MNGQTTYICMVLYFNDSLRLELIRVRNRLSSSFRLDFPVRGPSDLVVCWLVAHHINLV